MCSLTTISLSTSGTVEYRHMGSHLKPLCHFIIGPHLECFVVLILKYGHVYLTFTYLSQLWGYRQSSYMRWVGASPLSVWCSGDKLICRGQANLLQTMQRALTPPLRHMYYQEASVTCDTMLWQCDTCVTRHMCIGVTSDTVLPRRQCQMWHCAMTMWHLCDKTHGVLVSHLTLCYQVAVAAYYNYSQRDSA